MVGMRTYAKVVMRSPYYKEDWACLIAYALWIFYICTVLVMARYGEGYHEWEVTKDSYKEILRWLYIGSIMYCPAAYFTKMALLLLEARVFAVYERVPRGVFVFGIALLVCYIPILTLKSAVCIPVAAAWDSDIKPAQCMNQRKIFISDMCLGVFTDIVILILPIPLTFSLRMPLATKIKVVTLLSAGGIATGVSIYRLYKSVLFLNPSDRTEGFVALDLTTALELAIGIVCACLPTINLLVRKYVLVTGATGFIGAHVVDELLRRGIRVRGATRTVAKGQAMIKARPQYADLLDFVQIDDFENPNVFKDSLGGGIDGVIHVASPFTYDTKDNEKELILPAIQGVEAILQAVDNNPGIKRIVVTSSFAAVLDADRKAPPYFTYTGTDWNPLSREEAGAPGTSAVIAYRGSKKFAELAAWDHVANGDKHFDIVTLCPPMTFGPVVHPVDGVSKLNESNAMLWKIANGQKPLPVARVPFWIDVRDLAVAHVEALLRPEVGGKRYIPAASDRFSYGLAAKVMTENFPWAAGRVTQEEQAIDTSHGLDSELAAKELGLNYRTFDQTVVDLIKQAKAMEAKEAEA
ncbi:putative uncharacterized oxidoreductase [Colletotrichum spinosum]|uniref:Uncharacterized oxidoreductase n=1 Tax=Colletotrichum spinosum TaxID=1347390 RepID=A0A4R8QIL2_9PEZI|nr:putative uncharacterized oxidoreductase [Colletotrichum spinosum]